MTEKSMLVPKADWERKIFTEFVAASGLQVDADSIESRKPPEPDIRFSVNGRIHYAELGEITDQDLARRVVLSLRTGTSRGGFYSQELPLARLFRSKNEKTYDVGDAPLWLLAHYDKQYPAVEVDPDLIPRTVGDVAAQMVQSGVWAKLWVYDGWGKQVLWAFPL